MIKKIMIKRNDDNMNGVININKSENVLHSLTERYRITGDMSFWFIKVEI